MKITRATVVDTYDTIVTTYEFVASLPEHVARDRAFRRLARHYEMTYEKAMDTFVVEVTVVDAPFPIVVS